MKAIGWGGAGDIRHGGRPGAAIQGPGRRDRGIRVSAGAARTSRSFAIASAKLTGAGRVFAVDRMTSRLDMARAQGAETVDSAPRTRSRR